MDVLLPPIWFLLLSLTAVLFIMLDGADLGIGFLSLAASESRRTAMLEAIGPLWYANETWLVIAGAILFGAFPLAYGVILSSMYIPVMMILFGLMFRAVSIEFRSHSVQKSFWGYSVGAGSLLAILGQGFLLGGLLTNLSVKDGAFAGGPWDWLSGLSLVITLGVLAGYCMLGSAYLVTRTGGETQARSWLLLRVCALCALTMFAVITILMPVVPTPIYHMWVQSPRIYSVPFFLLAGMLSFIMLISVSSSQKNARATYSWAIIAALSAVGELIAAIFPYFIPFSVSIYDAASSTTSLVFMLYGVGVVLPIIIVYNVYVRRVFGVRKDSSAEAEKY